MYMVTLIDVIMEVNISQQLKKCDFNFSILGVVWEGCCN